MLQWETNTTTYQIGRGQWALDRVARGLDADVVRMAAASARRHGLRFGVYLSPWDIHRDPAMPKPLLAGTPYDEPQIFGDNNSDPGGGGGGGDYNELYARQLTELVTMQLPSDDEDEDGDGGGARAAVVELSEIWLDGASGSDTVQTFDWALFRDIIRLHQPGAVMWGHQGVDARWVGNEDGRTAATNWHTIDRTQDDPRYGEAELEVGVRDGAHWTPAEADARLRDGWFWHAGEQAKTADALMDMYLASVGRGVNLLLDVPPDTTGQIPQADVDVLLEFKERREAFLNRTLLVPGFATNASSFRGNSTRYGPANVLDGNSGTYWALDDGQTTGALEVQLGDTYVVDAFITQEYIALGQRIGGYAVDAFVDGAFEEIVNGTSLGYKRIDKLDAPVETDRIRLRVTQANAAPLVVNFQALGKLGG